MCSLNQPNIQETLNNKGCYPRITKEVYFYSLQFNTEDDQTQNKWIIKCVLDSVTCKHNQPDE